MGEKIISDFADSINIRERGGSYILTLMNLHSAHRYHILVSKKLFDAAFEERGIDEEEVLVSESIIEEPPNNYS
jgi:hypothetical protein